MKLGVQYWLQKRQRRRAENFNKFRPKPKPKNDIRRAHVSYLLSIVLKEEDSHPQINDGDEIGNATLFSIFHFSTATLHQAIRLLQSQVSTEVLSHHCDLLYHLSSLKHTDYALSTVQSVKHSSERVATMKIVLHDQDDMIDDGIHIFRTNYAVDINISSTVSFTGLKCLDFTFILDKHHKEINRLFLQFNFKYKHLIDVLLTEEIYLHVFNGYREEWLKLGMAAMVGNFQFSGRRIHNFLSTVVDNGPLKSLFLVSNWVWECKWKKVRKKGILIPLMVLASNDPCIETSALQSSWVFKASSNQLEGKKLQQMPKKVCTETLIVKEFGSPLPHLSIILSDYGVFLAISMGEHKLSVRGAYAELLSIIRPYVYEYLQYNNLSVAWGNNAQVAATIRVRDVSAAKFYKCSDSLWLVTENFKDFGQGCGISVVVVVATSRIILGQLANDTNSISLCSFLSEMRQDNDDGGGKFAPKVQNNKEESKLLMGVIKKVKLHETFVLNQGRFHSVWQIQFTIFLYSWGQECSHGEGIVTYLRTNVRAEYK